MKRNQLVLIAFCLLISGGTNAQFLKKLGKRAEEAAQRTIERKVEEKTEEKTGQAIDSVFDAPKKLKYKKKGTSNNDEGTETPIEENNQSNNSISQEIVSGSTFFPNGNQLFSENFAADAQGDFPTNWETNSGGEVVLVGSEKALRLYPNGIYIAHTGKLPENYALDFELTTANLDYKGLSGSSFYVELVNEKSIAKTTASGAKFGFSLWKGSDIPNRIAVENWGKGVSKLQNNIDYKMADRLNGSIQFTVVVNGKRLRVYVDGEKAVDLPSFLQADAGRYIRFGLKGTNKTMNHLVAVHNISITEEGEDLRSMLLKGGFSTTKILFNSGSDKLKPESFEFLQKLGKTLQEDTSLRVMIVGHTDSDGDQVKNMTLSKARAFSVANYLIDEMGIDNSRLLTQGRGENEPVAENTSEEGKAQNRRVEFKKM